MLSANAFMIIPDITIEVVDHPVDPAVGGVDLALEVRLLVFRSGGGRPPLRSEFYPSLKNS